MRKPHARAHDARAHAHAYSHAPALTNVSIHKTHTSLTHIIHTCTCPSRLHTHTNLQILQYTNCLLPSVCIINMNSNASYFKVLDWLNVMIDSHLPKLLLMDEWQEHIIELKQAINAQVEFCDRIQPLKGHISHLINGGRLPSQERLTDYSIEILKF